MIEACGEIKGANEKIASLSTLFCGCEYINTISLSIRTSLFPVSSAIFDLPFTCNIMSR